ncbi:hypothetical protein FA95DRAFT_1614258 [Auriscalpium vulgare]|uniref:Uncharacterized protein n=1 Tax=Auriscalpium vulgare TaxID=40419 RepID=A0ACB8R010_9AGAM|nr:hypothetical protein FA95DRAFT_1614258 [Auriscalpium vulgare]
MLPATKTTSGSPGSSDATAADSSDAIAADSSDATAADSCYATAANSGDAIAADSNDVTSNTNPAECSRGEEVVMPTEMADKGRDESSVAQTAAQEHARETGPERAVDGPESGAETAPAGKTKTGKTKGKAKRAPAKKPLPHGDPGKAATDAAIHLVIAAHARGLCVQRQINIIYDNPRIDSDCGSCSSCLPRPIPEPRPLPPIAAKQPVIPELEDKTYKYERPLVKDMDEVVAALERAAVTVRRKMPWRPEWIMLSARCFLDQDTLKLITPQFHLLRSLEDLEARLKGRWRYWEDAGPSLWEEVKVIGDDMRERLKKRQEGKRAQRVEQTDKAHAEKAQVAAEEVHAALEKVGLGNVRRVHLRLGPSVAAPTSPSAKSQEPDTDRAPARPSTPPQITAPIAAHTLSPPTHRRIGPVSPAHFYGHAAPSQKRRAVSRDSDVVAADVSPTRKAARTHYKQTAAETSRSSGSTVTHATLQGHSGNTRKENSSPPPKHTRRSSRRSKNTA